MRLNRTDSEQRDITKPKRGLEAYDAASTKRAAWPCRAVFGEPPLALNQRQVAEFEVDGQCGLPLRVDAVEKSKIEQP
jgi:hypothetical protein